MTIRKMSEGFSTDSQKSYLVTKGQLARLHVVRIHNVGEGGHDGCFALGEACRFGHGDQQIHHLHTESAKTTCLP